MTTQVIRIELNVTDSYLSLMGMVGRIELTESIVLQDIEHSGLACIIKSQENDICRLLEEA